MTISIINGSPRKNGSTAQILLSMKKYLEKYDTVFVNYYNLIDMQILPCTGCRVCYKTGTCAIKNDGIENLAQTIKQSDGIIIGSPTFGSSMTGHLKSFLDRGHFIVEQSLQNKKCMAITTYEIAEGKSAYNQLTKFFVVSGGTLLPGVIVKMDFANKPVINDKLPGTIDKKAKEFHQAILKNKCKTIFEYLFTDIIIRNIIWKPIFYGRRDDFSGILKSWKEKNLI